MDKFKGLHSHTYSSKMHYEGHRLDFNLIYWTHTGSKYILKGSFLAKTLNNMEKRTVFLVATARFGSLGLHFSGVKMENSPSIFEALSGKN